VLVEAMGFELPPSLQESRRGAGPLHTLLLDFGPDGVLGWMAGLVDAQFGKDAEAVAPATAAASVVLNTAARAGNRGPPRPADQARIRPSGCGFGASSRSFTAPEAMDGRCLGGRRRPARPPPHQ
jgi:hypothetical protein